MWFMSSDVYYFVLNERKVTPLPKEKDSVKGKTQKEKIDWTTSLGRKNK